MTNFFDRFDAAIGYALWALTACTIAAALIAAYEIWGHFQ